MADEDNLNVAKVSKDYSSQMTGYKDLEYLCNENLIHWYVKGCTQVLMN
jgi:hypothetical protein